MALKLLKFLGIPFLVVGFLWYVLVEVGLYQGRLLAFSWVLGCAKKEYEDTKPT